MFLKLYFRPPNPLMGAYEVIYETPKVNSIIREYVLKPPQFIPINREGFGDHIQNISLNIDYYLINNWMKIARIKQAIL